MPEVILTLRAIRSRLRELREKYECSNEEFRSDPEIRARVSDEDEFEWEAFLAHQECTLQEEEDLHREYLARLDVSASCEVTEKSQAARLLAA